MPGSYIPKKGGTTPTRRGRPTKRATPAAGKRTIPGAPARARKRTR